MAVTRPTIEILTFIVRFPVAGGYKSLTCQVQGTDVVAPLGLDWTFTRDRAHEIFDQIDEVNRIPGLIARIKWLKIMRAGSMDQPHWWDVAMRAPCPPPGHRPGPKLI